MNDIIVLHFDDYLETKTTPSMSKEGTTSQIQVSHCRWKTDPVAKGDEVWKRDPSKRFYSCYTLSSAVVSRSEGQSKTRHSC